MNLVTAPALSFSLMLAGCSGLTRHGPVDSSLAAFIPSDAVALAGIRMDQIRTTPLYHKLAEQNKLPKFDAFRTESGFDPSQDVRELLVASDGQNVLAIARGTFTAKPSRDLESSDYRGYTLYAKSPDEVMSLSTRARRWAVRRRRCVRPSINSKEAATARRAI